MTEISEEIEAGTEREEVLERRRETSKELDRFFLRRVKIQSVQAADAA